MPTFSAIAFESLLEPSSASASASASASKLLKQGSKQSRQMYDANNPTNHSSHLYISPALYTTPIPQPLPFSPTSLSPSPYVYNRKSRHIPPPDHTLTLSGFQIPPKAQDEGSSHLSPPLLRPDQQQQQQDEEDEGLFDNQLTDGVVLDRDEGLDDFLNQSSVTSQSEFYDAPEEFFSDGSSSLASPSSSLKVETELHAARIHLLEEVRRRKESEQDLSNIHKQWLRIAQKVSKLGLSFPVISSVGKLPLEIDSVEQFCQEVIVARTVSELVGRGQARAESEVAIEAIIHSKNLEIARLQDKLHYCEAVNHEMSQRNQEIVGRSRQARQKWKRQRWIWSCIGASITIGASVLACSYLYHTAGRDTVLTSNESSDASSSPSNAYPR